ncbi:MAG: hypothetical protein MHM6MM_000305 [Cercozoa sp. M6MM]
MADSSNQALNVNTWRVEVAEPSPESQPILSPLPHWKTIVHTTLNGVANGIGFAAGSVLVYLVCNKIVSGKFTLSTNTQSNGSQQTQ